MSTPEKRAEWRALCEAERVHLMYGLCPDRAQPDVSDPECPACRRDAALPELLDEVDALRERINRSIEECHEIAVGRDALAARVRELEAERDNNGAAYDLIRQDVATLVAGVLASEALDRALADGVDLAVGDQAHYAAALALASELDGATEADQPCLCAGCRAGKSCEAGDRERDRRKDER